MSPTAIQIRIAAQNVAGTIADTFKMTYPKATAGEVDSIFSAAFIGFISGCGTTIDNLMGSRFVSGDLKEICAAVAEVENDANLKRMPEPGESGKN